MLGRKKLTYVVYTSDEGRWTAKDVSNTEKKALSNAENLLGSRQYDAVKVVSEDGSGREKIIFEQKCAKKEKPVTVSAVDSAPVCTDLEDFYRFPARRTMGLLLRKYLDREVLTALEILHSQRHMKTLMRKDPLFNQALGRVAGLHATATGKPQMECYEFLDKMSREIAKRCLEQREMDQLGALLADKGFAAVAKKAGEGVSAKRDFLYRTALGAQLGTTAGWGGKIEIAAELLAKPENKSGISFVDDAIAEIIDGAEAMKEILGHQEDLAAALRALSDLSRGRYEVPKTAPEYVEILNDAILKYRLPNSRQILLERMRRELAGIKGLTRDGAKQEGAFIDILRGLIVPLGLRGGSSMAEGIVQRARLVYQSKGAGTIDGAIRKVLELIPIPLSRIGFLLAVMSTELAEKAQPAVETALKQIIDNMHTLKDALPGAKMSPPLKAAIEELAGRARKTEISDVMRKRVSETLQGLLVEPKAGGGALAEEQSAAPVEAPIEAEVLPPVLCNHGLEFRTFHQGETLCARDQAGAEAFYIVNGLAMLTAGKDEKNRSVETINPENLVGGEVLAGRPKYKNTVQAMTDLEAFVVPRTLVESRVQALEQKDPLMHFVLTSVGKI